MSIKKNKTSRSFDVVVLAFILALSLCSAVQYHTLHRTYALELAENQSMSQNS